MTAAVTITISGKVTSDRIQPDNWRNIGTKYQHEQDSDTIVFDTYNREVTLNGVGIDNNLTSLTNTAFGARG